MQQGRKVKRKHLIESAVAKYSEGLSILASAAGKPDPALLCALCSNRALAESLLGNWRNSLDSALWAIRADSTHLKSYYRAARAAQELKRWQQGQTLCAKGLEIEPDAAELLGIQEVRRDICRGGTCRHQDAACLVTHMPRACTHMRADPAGPVEHCMFAVIAYSLQPRVAASAGVR